MEMRIITETQLCEYEAWLREAEKSDATMEKYLRDVRAFLGYMQSGAVEKTAVMAYKQQLIERGYAVRSINSMLASLNSFFDFWVGRIAWCGASERSGRRIARRRRS